MSENIPPQQQLYPTNQHDAMQHAQRGPDMGSAMRPLMLPGIQEGFNAAVHAGPAGPGYHSQNLPGIQEGFNATRTGPAGPGYHSQNHTAGHFRKFSQDITNQLHTNYATFQNVGHQHRKPFHFPLPCLLTMTTTFLRLILQVVVHRDL